MALGTKQEEDSCAPGEDVCSKKQSALRRAQLRLLDMLVEFHRICEKHNISYYISGGTCLGAIRHDGFIPWDDDVDIDIWYEDYIRLLRILPGELPDYYKLQTTYSDPGFYCNAARIVDCDSQVIYPNKNFVRRKFKYQGLFIDLLPVAPSPLFGVKCFIDKVGSASFFKKKCGGLTDYKTYVGYLLWPLFIPLSTLYKRLARHSRSKILTHYHVSIAPATPRINHDDVFPVKPLQFEGRTVYGPRRPDAYLRSLYGNYLLMPPISKRRIHAEKIRVFEVEGKNNEIY